MPFAWHEGSAVQYLVEGSVRRSSNRLRVNVQLINAERGAHVWGERFDRDLTDVFALQDEIVSRILTALTGALQNYRFRQRTSSIEAYDLFVRGARSSRNGRNQRQRHVMC